MSAVRLPESFCLPLLSLLFFVAFVRAISLFRGYISSAGGLVFAMHNANSGSSSSPQQYGDESKCTMQLAAGSIPQRVFMWAAASFDPARNELKVYLITPFTVLEGSTRC